MMSQDNSAAPRMSGIVAVIDYFQHPALMRESDLRHRSRILIAGLLFLTLLLTVTALVTLVAPFPPAAKLAAVIIAGCFALVSLYLLFSLRRRGNYLACSMAIVVADYVAIIAGIVVSEGGTASATLQLLAFPALLGYFFGGIRWGAVTSAAALLAIVVFAALEHMGVTFYMFNDPALAEEAKIFISVVGLSAASGMAYIYEYTAVMLKRERDLEQANVNRLAHTDALTGLANRFSFDMELATRIDAAAKALPQRPLALCYLDLNGFKPINDRFGHDVGDEILQIVSERLRMSLRNVDYVGRQGGDEFVIILDDIHDKHLLQMVAERVLAAIAQPMPTSGGEILISGSLGMACFPDHATNAEALRQAADHAMYTAKQTGTGWFCHTSSLPRGH